MTKFLKGFTIEVDKIPKYAEFNGKFTEHIDNKLCDMIVKRLCVLCKLAILLDFSIIRSSNIFPTPADLFLSFE